MALITPPVDADMIATKAMMETLLRALAGSEGRSGAATGTASGNAVDAGHVDAGLREGGDSEMQGGSQETLAQNVLKLSDLLQSQSGRGRLRRLRRDAHISRVVLDLATGVVASAVMQKALLQRVADAEANVHARARALDEAVLSCVGDVAAAARKPLQPEVGASDAEDRDGSHEGSASVSTAVVGVQEEPTTRGGGRASADADRARAARRAAEYRLRAAVLRKASKVEVGEVFVSRFALTMEGPRRAQVEWQRARRAHKRELARERSSADAWGVRPWLRGVHYREAMRCACEFGRACEDEDRRVRLHSLRPDEPPG